MEMETTKNSQPDLNFLFKLAYYPDKHLKTRTALVTDFEPLPLIAETMFKTMTVNHGIGLAANQCKLNLRMFIIRTERIRKAFVNPTIAVPDGARTVEEDETCLSFPGIVTKVERYPSIVVRACDLQGNTIAVPLEGIEAICAQHEMDHLNGITFLDKRSRLARISAERTIKKVLKDPRCLTQRKRL